MPRKKKIDQYEALARMQQYCAIQERAQSEVYKKLRALEMTHEQTQQIISELIESDFINESRFAEAYVRGKFRMNHWGKRKIEMGLKNKRISARNIAKALETIATTDYEEKLKDLMAKYIRQNALDAKDWVDQQKLLRYILQKGYEIDTFHVVYTKLRSQSD